MKEALFKARWTFRRPIDAVTARYVAFEQSIWLWLSENDRLSAYVNSYINTDDASDTLEYVVVMRDRDSALMMKLALG